MITVDLATRFCLAPTIMSLSKIARYDSLLFKTQMVPTEPSSDISEASAKSSALSSSNVLMS